MKTKPVTTNEQTERNCSRTNVLRILNSSAVTTQEFSCGKCFANYLTQTDRSPRGESKRVFYETALFVSDIYSGVCGGGVQMIMTDKRRTET